MKKIMQIFRTAIVAIAFVCGALLISCTDYLTVYPANSTIHENFWQTADDVKGIMATSYLQLMDEASVKRMVIWGELRSDNMNVREGKDQNLAYISEGNLKPESEYCSWGKFYSAINYANMVIEFAPQVVGVDPDFSQGDLDIIMGEMYALRALSHFYLLRTFRDIPLAYKASLNDSELPVYPQVHPMVALDSIMSDLDKAENLVMAGEFPSASYGGENQNYNNGRIVKTAVFAIKADVNLWRAAFAEYYMQNGVDSENAGIAALNESETDGAEGSDGTTDGDVTDGEGTTGGDDGNTGDTPVEDTPATDVTILSPDEYYRMAIENCDSVINRMNSKMMKFYKESGVTETAMAVLGVGPGTENPYFLTSNSMGSGSSSSSDNKYSLAYYYLFGEGKDISSTVDRSEIIFELKYDGLINENTAIRELYGYSADTGPLYVPEELTLSDKTIKNTSRVFYKNDYRLYSSTTSTGNSLSPTEQTQAAPGGMVRIAKYAAKTTPGYNLSPDDYRDYSQYDANWVIYRKSDVLLMKAEALTQISTAAEKQNMYDAFKLVKAVNDRSKIVVKDSLTQVNDLTLLQDLVLNERRRELAYEGKRWYDLVRVALRANSTQPILFIADKLGGGAGQALRKKMQTINTLFFPIASSELNVNPLLVQNPAYEESSILDKN